MANTSQWLGKTGAWDDPTMWQVFPAGVPGAGDTAAFGYMPLGYLGGDVTGGTATVDVLYAMGSHGWPCDLTFSATITANTVDLLNFTNLRLDGGVLAATSDFVIGSLATVTLSNGAVLSGATLTNNGQVSASGGTSAVQGIVHGGLLDVGDDAGAGVLELQNGADATASVVFHAGTLRLLAPGPAALHPIRIQAGALAS
jgi:hypothetical protein